MTHKDIFVRIRAAVPLAFVCVVMVYTIETMYASELLQLGDALYKRRVTAWQCVTLVTAVPCVLALIFAWKISDFVRLDRSFSRGTAKMLKNISNCALADALYYLAANIAMFFVGANHASILLVSLVLILLAVAIGIAFAALARFVQKAADLQEESDLTI